MAQNNPTLWQTEPIENFLDQHLLFRGIHRNIWKYWGDDITDIQENFITFPRKTKAQLKLSVDWSKFCQNPEDLLNRLFLISYSRKRKISISRAIQDLGISQNTSIYGLSISDLKIPNDIILKARKINGIFRFKSGDLLEIIEEKQLPIELKHNPIKTTNKTNLFLNRAHSDIEGFSRTNYTRIRALLCDKAKWVKDLDPIME